MTESSVVTIGGCDRAVSMLEVGRLIAEKDESNEKRMERLENKMDQNMNMFIKMFENFQSSQNKSGETKDKK